MGKTKTGNRGRSRTGRSRKGSTYVAHYAIKLAQELAWLAWCLRSSHHVKIGVLSNLNAYSEPSNDRHWDERFYT
jgi:hypothetical protein